MMNIPDKRRAISAISEIKNDLFKERRIRYVDPLIIPDFNDHITKPVNTNRNAIRNTRFGNYMGNGLQ